MHRRIAGLALALTLLTVTAPARASHTSSWTRTQQVARNNLSRMTGILAHQAIQGYASAAFHHMEPRSNYWGPIPDEFYTEYEIDLAPSKWKLKEGLPVSDGEGGKADIMAKFNYRPAAPNICEIYEIKPWGQSYSSRYSWIHLLQLQGYLDGIDKDRSIPCWSKPGLSWQPARYPNWHEVPRAYTMGLAEKGMSLDITTTCSLEYNDWGGSAWSSSCGLIYYRFRWSEDEDEKNARSVKVRSWVAFTILNQWIERNFGKRALQRAASGEDGYSLVAKFEVTNDGLDSFQEFIDVVAPNGLMDPNVQSLEVVNHFIDFANQVPSDGWLTELWKSVKGLIRNLIVPGANPRGRCPIQNPQGEEQLPLCG